MPSLLGILPGVCAFGKAQSLKNSIFYIPHLPKWDGEMGLVLLPFSPLKLTLKILFSVHVLWNFGCRSHENTTHSLSTRKSGASTRSLTLLELRELRLRGNQVTEF